MAEQSNWIDYANLAASIFENSQLHDVQNNLEATPDNEQAIVKAENKFREVVFQADVALAKLRALSSENRIRALALARESLLNFEQYLISSAVFRAAEDKEKLRVVLDGYETLAGECSAAILPLEREEAELCAKYHAEQGGLNLLIELREKQEALDLARAEPHRLKGETVTTAAGLATVLLGIGGALFCIGFYWEVYWIVVWGFSGIADRGKASLAIGLGMCGLLGAWVPWVWGSVLLRRVDTSKTFQEAYAQTRATELEATVSSESSLGIPKSLQEKHGTTPLAELRRMRVERDALIAKVFKSEGSNQTQPREQPCGVPPPAEGAAGHLQPHPIVRAAR